MFFAVCAAPGGQHGAAARSPEPRHSIRHFRTEMGKTVRADHPAVQPIATAIREITTDRLQQLVIVNDVSHLLVDYDDDRRIYGPQEYHATLDEMIARRRNAGWAYMRDDCDGRAVLAAHILSALGITWRLEASYWKEHAWIVAEIGGVEYDLLDLRGNARETDRLSYKLFGRFFVRSSRPPPHFDWREAWVTRSKRDLQLGLTLGLLTLDSTKTSMRTRYATNWTKRAPQNPLPPLDDARTLMAGVAAFPYGEPLHLGALDKVKSTPSPGSEGSALAGSTHGNSATVEATR